MKKAGIAKVYYSNNNGNITMEHISKINSNHISKGQKGF